MEEKIDTAQKRKSVIEVFLGGCRRGFKLSIEQVMPAMVLGYVLVQFFKLSGAMNLMGGNVQACYGTVLACQAKPLQY